MHIHLIGVAGTAMATLAAMLQRRGHRVTGSDAGVYPPMSDFLRAEHIEVHDGYDASHVDPAADLVVVGNAISRGNVELETVLSRRQRYCSLPERIRDEFLWERDPIVIAGTHGKTTTTSMVAWVLTHAGLDPSLLVGGIAANFEASYRLGAGRDFVIEGDEYDSAFFDKTAKFLKYVPETVVVNNVEFDHADIYPDLAAILTAFTRLLRLVPSTGRVFIGADDAGAASLIASSAFGTVETFGLAEGAHWQARDLRPGPSGTTFDVWKGTATGNGQPATGNGTTAGTSAARVPGDGDGPHDRRAQRPKCPGGDRRGLVARRAVCDHRRGARDLCRRQAPDGTAWRRARRLGVRRLRPPSDRHRGDPEGRASGASRGAHLGALRAALGLQLPERVPGGLRGRLCGCRRGRDCLRVPHERARGRPPLRTRPGRGSRRRAGSAPTTSQARPPSSTWWRARRARATSSS